MRHPAGPLVFAIVSAVLALSLRATDRPGANIWPLVHERARSVPP